MDTQMESFESAEVAKLVSDWGKRLYSSHLQWVYYSHRTAPPTPEPGFSGPARTWDRLKLEP
jgi:hypothetical protein